MDQYNNPDTVTYIDDLPDIDEIDSGNYYQRQNDGHTSFNRAYGRGGMPEPPSQAQLQSKIRKSAPIPQEAGMSSSHGNVHHQPQPQQHMPSKYLPTSAINCLDIAEHVKDCPICSKFYKNDNTVYIIVIVILVILCILLLKRVLDI